MFSPVGDNDSPMMVENWGGKPGNVGGPSKTVTHHILQQNMLYCRTGNFRVFKFSRISDFGTFHEI